MRRHVVTLALALAVCAAPLQARAQLAGGPFVDFRSQLGDLAVHAPGRVAVEIKDLTTGYTSGINATDSMPAASTIKIPVMVEVFRQLSLGKFDFNTTVALHASDKDWGSGWLCDRRAGSRYPVSELLTAMITVSDNTATNMLIRLVGRQSINGTMTGMGLQHTRLGDYIRSEGNGIRWALRSSPADMVTLLSQMAKEQLIDEWSSREMVTILSGQRHNSLLPAPLPDDLQIAHKTGTLHDTLNDVGIVYASESPYVIAVMTTNLPSLSRGRAFIRGVSKLAYDDVVRFMASREGPAQDTGAASATDVTPQLPASGADTPMWGGDPTPPPASR